MDLENPLKIAKEIKRFNDNAKYFNRNYSGLKKQHPDEYVAIHRQKVIGHGRDISQLVRDLREEGIDTGEVFIERTYFKEEESTLILAAA
tara:strand:- start:116 stop:385 length:270 start_codon:yes stop_codon:yes gene_type:complete